MRQFLGIKNEDFVNVHIFVWIVTPYSQVAEGTYFFQFQRTTDEGVFFFLILVRKYQATACHNPQGEK